MLLGGDAVDLEFRSSFFVLRSFADAQTDFRFLIIFAVWIISIMKALSGRRSVSYLTFKWKQGKWTCRVFLLQHFFAGY